MLYFHYINSWTQWMWQIFYLRNVFYWKELLKKNLLYNTKILVLFRMHIWISCTYIFFEYLNPSFTLIYWNCHVNKSDTYIRKVVSKYFIWKKYFSTLLHSRETWCNFVCKCKHDLFFKPCKLLFTVLILKLLVIKNVTYFKNFNKYFIRFKCFSMLFSIKEILLCNFLCKFKCTLCIVLIFKHKTF